jgi:hypothetical protein
VVATDESVFNDLAIVAIYHYADCNVEPQARKAARRLKKLGIITGIDDADTAYENYEEKVIEYATEHLPNRFNLQYDYWGAKCISDHKGWNATKNGLYAGDSMGRIMFFSSFEALKQYTQQKLDLIQHEADVAEGIID